MYDIHRLRLLRELSHRKTLAAVANALGYSPSAVSHQLGLLEREVGVSLLEPLGRGVRLTADADALVVHTEAILQELEQAEADVAAARGSVRGTIRLASFQTAAHAIVPDAVRRLARRHPDLRVECSHIGAEEALPALLARDFDLVLWEQYPGQASRSLRGVVMETLANDPMLLATPPDWIQGDVGELSEVPWILEPPGTEARVWATAICHAAGYEPRVAFESSDLLLHTRLVQEGLAAAFLPTLTVSDIGARGAGLISARLMGQSRRIMMARRSGSQANPAIAAARDVIKAALPETLAADA